MALVPGSRLGPYDVAAQIGAGGMGEVYRATDTNLKRSVAIKVLPASVAADDERLARFQREAEVLASLNHPNIAAIYGLERSAGTTALVMELVEGPTLADRIEQGAIPVDEALAIARQIAEALEAAHEQGVVHRDLKPANVKVRPDGTVKVLDFGLAKAMEPASALRASAGQAEGVAALSLSPTIASPMMTQAGIILGTAAYMSPEQARGKAVDKRADIWAFGAVLFEMLTAVRAFPGGDVTDTIVSVISKEPDWPALPSSTPASIQALLRRCLEKDPRRRLRDIGEGRLTLERGSEASAAMPVAVTRTPLVWKGALAIGALAIVGLGVPAVQHLREAPPAAPAETRVDIVTPSTDEPASFALSPDGRRIAFVASDDGGSRLWLRSLATTAAVPLAGTERAISPFWAPDGRALGFFADGALKRLDLGDAGATTGSARVLAQATNGSGGTWSAGDVIVFAPTATTALMRIPAAGGAAVAMTTLGPQHSGHTAPQFLPDGRRFLFYVFGGADVSGIYLGGLDGPPTRLTASDSAGVFVPGGRESDIAPSRGDWILWVRDGALVGQRLDVEQGRLTGEWVTVADGVSTDWHLYPGLSAAGTGLIAYRTGGVSPRQLTWLDRSGAARGTVGEIDGTLLNPRVSPDGRRVVVTRMVQGNYDVWLLDGARTSRVTFDAAREDFPIWSSDGADILFRSNRGGPFDIFQKAASGAGAEEQLGTSEQLKVPSSMSADGRFLLYLSIDPQTNADLWVMPMTGDRKPSVISRTPFREVWPVFSPDGRWIAYQSNESGRPEIYVRGFVAPGETGAAEKTTGGQWQVSTAGGIMPAWRPDGRELYYLDPTGAMMAVPITVTASAIDPGAPVKLFPTRIYGGGVDAQQGPQYSVAPDGRFLINTELNVADAPITLLMNWNPEAKKP